MVVIISLLNVAAYSVLVSVLLITFIYVSARIASVAWYKSKWEHFKRVLAITNLKEESNGED
jgi:hypothetical protein